jgi:hypothetical protein
MIAKYPALRNTFLNLTGLKTDILPMAFKFVDKGHLF